MREKNPVACASLGIILELDPLAKFVAKARDYCSHLQEDESKPQVCSHLQEEEWEFLLWA
jgi:hypothetical protein